MCSQDTCDKPVHSKGLCQNHYRQAKRQERGLKPRGPQPDPTKPRSRHGKARKNEGKGYRGNELGGTCRKGHELTADTAYPTPTGGLKCKVCRANGQARRAGKEEPNAVKVWNKNKTHCSKGHEYAAVKADGTRVCLACRSESSRAWRLKALYDISVEQFDVMLQTQGNSCSICSREFEDLAPVVDHDHETGAVRALLCTNCNTGLGQFYDNTELLTKAIAYLERFSKTASE